MEEGSDGGGVEEGWRRDGEEGLVGVGPTGSLSRMLDPCELDPCGIEPCGIEPCGVEPCGMLCSQGGKRCAGGGAGPFKRVGKAVRVSHRRHSGIRRHDWNGCG